jgi:hypothetical protein
MVKTMDDNVIKFRQREKPRPRMSRLRRKLLVIAVVCIAFGLVYAYNWFMGHP